MNRKENEKDLELKDEQDKSETEKQIEKKLSELLREHIPNETLDMEILRKWIEDDKARKRAVRRKLIAAAGSALAVCFGVRLAVSSRKGEFYRGGTGEHEKFIYGKQESVTKARKKFKDLAVPKYVPDGFEFRELKVEKENDRFSYTYKWWYKGDEVVLTESTLPPGQKSDFDYDTSFKCGDKYTIYIKEGNEKKACWTDGDHEFRLIGNCKKKEICKIAAGLRF